MHQKEILVDAPEFPSVGLLVQLGTQNLIYFKHLSHCVCMNQDQKSIFFLKTFNLQRVGDGFTASLLKVCRTPVKNNNGAENWTWTTANRRKHLPTTLRMHEVTGLISVVIKRFPNWTFVPIRWSLFMHKQCDVMCHVTCVTPATLLCWTPWLSDMNWPE